MAIRKLWGFRGLEGREGRELKSSGVSPPLIASQLRNVPDPGDL